MFKFIKNKFLFILLISIVTLVVLVIGAISLYKDTSSIFASDGYIIETSTKTNTKYYFSANTKYKENVEEKITFEDKDKNKVSVDPASFVHYDNGNISFLQKGALVNLSDITAPMVSYYNITSENTITYEQNHYTVTSNDKKINIDSFIGRINDSKYIVAGENLSLKIPIESGRISGDYFEVHYLEEGIVKIDNKDHSYQVTAQDSYIYVGDNITISLGDGKIFYDGDAKMLMSQITINNNENINLDVEENKGGGSGNGSGEGDSQDGTGIDGEGTGEGTGGGDGTGEGEGTEEGDGTGEETGEGNGTGEGTGEGEGGEETGNAGTTEGTNTTASLQIELIEAKVTSTTIDLKMQLNNANLARGNVVAYLTNVATGDKEPSKRIELKNAEFDLQYTKLVPNTNYSLVILETNVESEIQYFQKIFITKDLGLTLEKKYATSKSLAYELIFDGNTEVTEAHVIIQKYDKDGELVEKAVDETTIGINQKRTFDFLGLESNTQYKITVDEIVINNGADVNYLISRDDTTLKETPVIYNLQVDADAEKANFTLKLNNIEDEDNSIISYTYYIYLAEEFENPGRQIQCNPITKVDSDPLVLNINEVGLTTGVDYRAEVVARYNDNEMIREVTSTPSNNFLIADKPKIEFKQEEPYSINSAKGTVTLIDPNCTVPMQGRMCGAAYSEIDDLKLKYYDLATNVIKEIPISFNKNTLTYDLSLEKLKSNSKYAVEIIGNYKKEDGTVLNNVLIGDVFYVYTKKSENIYFEMIGPNTSNGNTVVTFDAKFLEPEDKTTIEEIDTVTFNLYSGRENDPENLIGTYTVTDKKKIEQLFSNITIENSLFTDVTGNNLEKLDTIEKLIIATGNTGTLSGAYTVEVEDVYDLDGENNKFTIENNVKTFNLTPSYYLDARIETNPDEPYVTVTPITKENLTEEEYEELVENSKFDKTKFDKLNAETIVGITIDNSLSDMFVNSAYQNENYNYKKVSVYYTICNSTLNKCDESSLASLIDNNPDNDQEASEKIKFIRVDMGDKYQTKSSTFYLDYTNDPQDFIRGYNYKIGFHMTFVREDGSITNYTNYYTNEKLYQTISLERQTPKYTQYISTSTSTGITYRYSFSDVDNGLADANFYYKLNGSSDYQKVTNALIADEKYNDVTLPIDNNSTYTLYYSKKTTQATTEFVEITTNDFETEYDYNDENAYTVIDKKNNTLTIKLDGNDVINRTYVYKVVIESLDNPKLTPYTRYFLASKLNVLTEDTGEFDKDGNPISKDYKYIAIDYANINGFMKQNLKVTVYSYFDSGLVGYNQTFTNGIIFKNRTTNKFLNIYNGASNITSTVSEDDINMGLYLLKEPFKKDGESLFIYNHLQDTKTYNPFKGATYYDTKDLAEKIGVEFGTNPDNKGMVLTVGKAKYKGYDAKVLKEAKLLTENNAYRFETIVPTIEVITNKKNTINSIRISINPKGIYDKKQFIKDNKPHDVAYVELYSDAECNNRLETKETNINIKDGETTINDVEFKNLNPQTTYYVKVFAYVNNEYTRIYDDSSTTASYITKTYEAKTLNSNGIMSAIKFHIKPIEYNGESSKKQLNWQVTLKSTANYKLRFELYKPKTIIETDPETGEEVTITNFVPVKFDGTDANSCSIDKSGSSSNGYIYKDKDDIDNCYISVDKDDIDNLDNINGQKYTFTGDDFVFGGNYYQLKVYAIPYTNDSYIEDQKVLLYQNDSLTTTPTIDTVNGVKQDIDIPRLAEADFSLSDSLRTGFVSDDEGYYISFVPTITDEHYVMKKGEYTITLKDKDFNIVGSEPGKKCTYYINKNNDPVKKIADECVIKMDAKSANQKIDFTGLTSDTPYYIELSYKTYRNNYGFTDEQKKATYPFTYLIYTPISNDISIGIITANKLSNTSVQLTYSGSYNLSEKIVRVDYTITQMGGGGTVSGTYRIDNNNSSIFKNSNETKLTINTKDTNSSNPSFEFVANKMYNIQTTYYYLNEVKEEKILTTETTTMLG